MRKEAYGGFLPLELNEGREWFESYSENSIRFNSVKAGINYLLKEKAFEKIYVPYYYCPSTIQAIINTGVKIEYYHIDEKFCPIIDFDKVSGIVLLVNYFGIVGELINKIVNENSNIEFIIDNAHAFYEEPRMQSNIYTLYSAKKFFGVPDGAYLIGTEIKNIEEEIQYASEYVNYLIVAYEKGTNAAYNNKKDADLWIANNYGAMSVLSRGLLKNVDYDKVRDIREDNYETLNDILGMYNEINIPLKKPAYLFPLLTGNGYEIKKLLVKNKIYVPTLWTCDELLNNGNEFELHMSKDAVFLPIDQRYNKKDMEIIVSYIKEEM